MNSPLGILALTILLAIEGTVLGQPVITRSPTNQSVSLGAKLTLSVTASGIAPLTFQWHLGDSILANATNRTLTLTNVQLNQAGPYSALVSDSSGVSTSKVAFVDVDPTFVKISTGPVVNDGADGENDAWVDIDNDGDLDLYVNSGDAGLNLLYRNDGQGNFTKITGGPLVSAGASSSAVSWADIDNDGLIDAFIGKLGSQKLPGLIFHQQPDGSFTRTNLPGTGYAWDSAFADYNNDGFLDLVVADTARNVLWQNDRTGNFVANTNVAIVTQAKAGSSLGSYSVTWVDYDNDGDLDLLVANLTGDSQLYRNDGAGSFVPITNGPIAHSGGGSGAAWGDYDNDGFVDLFLPRLPGTGSAKVPLLFHNQGDGTFTLPSQHPFDEAVGDWTGAVWGDYDNDGYLDLFVSEFLGRKSRLYHNNRDGTFTRVLSGSLANDQGSSGAPIWGDYDHDGFLDLFVSNGTNGGGESNDYLYHNNGPNAGNTNSWIIVRCVGTASNRSAVGAKVRVKASLWGKTVWQMRLVGNGSSGLPLEMHFGLGDATIIETLRVEWPSGTVQEISNVQPRQILTLSEPVRLAMLSPERVAVQSWPGQSFLIEASDDLFHWASIGSVTNLTGSLQFPVAKGSARNRQFFRARQN